MSLESTRREVAQRLLGARSSRAGARTGSSSAFASSTVTVSASRVEASPPAPLSMVDCLARRATFGADAETRAEIEAIGSDAWLQRQLRPRRIDDRVSDAVVESSADLTQGNGPGIRLMARAVTTKRQLAWRTAYFWNNHFSTYRRATVSVSEVQEDAAFYRLAFSGFAELLQASAKSPAMIDYLDSRSNRAGRPNENYARELLELHTLGVNGGYTEADVAEVARVFTGWSRQRVTRADNRAIFSSFEFLDDRHDDGAKALSFGWSTPGISGPAGVQEGESLLDFLAAMPQTAQRTTAKLCRYFASDTPSVGMLQRVEQRFTASLGSIEETVTAIFGDPDFAAACAARDKVRDGFELVANLMRRGRPDTISWVATSRKVEELSSLPHENPVPTGYAENGEAWQGPGNLLPRWNMADDFAFDRFGPTEIPWLTWFPTWPTTGAGYVQPLLDRFIDGDVPASTEAALTAFMDGLLATGPSNFNQNRNLARILLSTILQLPEVQLH